MKQPKLYIGIDPDLNKSGFAYWCPISKQLRLSELTMYDLFSELCYLSGKHDLTVYLEAGHKIKSHWHKRSVGTAKNVGKNHAVGQLIEQFLIDHNIRHHLIKPAGYSSWTHEKFCKVTGWPVKKRTNPEKRVAGLLIFGRD